MDRSTESSIALIYLLLFSQSAIGSFVLLFSVNPLHSEFYFNLVTSIPQRF